MQDDYLKRFAARLRSIRQDVGMTQDELAQAIGTSKSVISGYETARNDPSQSMLVKLAKSLGVSIDYLTGIRQEVQGFEIVDLSPYASIPVLGSIPAGVPIEAIEDIVDHIDIPLKWVKSDDDYFALKVRGDSMYPLFLDGDTVIIRRQTTAETGDICACYVNGFDATLKRVKISEAGAITLQPENTNYPPMTYTHPGEVTIAGKVVEVRRPV